MLNLINAASELLHIPNGIKRLYRRKHQKTINNSNFDYVDIDLPVKILPSLE